MQVRISSVAISVQRRTGIGCYPLSGAYRDKLLIIHKLGGMSCLDGLQCLFRQEQDGQEGGPGLSDLRDSEPSGVKEGAAVDNVCAEDSEKMEGFLDEDVSSLSEVTVCSPPCSAPAILQAAPATKALRPDPPCSSNTRFKPKLEPIVECCRCSPADLYRCGIPGCQEIQDAQHTKAWRRPQKIKNRKWQAKAGASPCSSETRFGDLTIVGNHVWYGPGTLTGSPGEIIPDAAAALRSLTSLALEAQREFLTSGIA